MIKSGTYKSEKFIQRKRTFFNKKDGLNSDIINCLLLKGDGTLIIGTDSGLNKMKADKITPLYSSVITGNVSVLKNLSGGDYAAASNENMFIISSGRIKKYRSFDETIVDIELYKTRLWVLTENTIYCIDYKTGRDILTRGLEGGKGRCLAVSDNNIYVATELNISLVHGKRMEWKNILPRFSNLPAGTVQYLTFDEQGYLWVGMKERVCVFDNGSLWLTSENLNSLPKNGASKIVCDKSGGRYFASDAGIIFQKNGGTKYLSAERWVPDNNIKDIAVSDDGSMLFAATDRGLSKIESFYLTLSEKAAIYEDITEKYHIRRGFTASRNIRNGNFYDGEPGITDNDGLWTACYVAAESFRYAATGDKDALAKARRGMKAMLLLTKITGIPGFTARAVRYPGDPGYKNGDPEWSESPDKSCEWKGETSSDEMTGHFFGLSVYYDLCASKSEKAKIRSALLGIMTHIIDNGFVLIDRDGLPTTWACWNPEQLNHSDKWFVERGINSLELLAFLKVCYHISGDRKYDELYSEFISKHHYALNVMQYKIRDAHICHIDDNLGFLAELTLLRLEENEALRSFYLSGLEDHWQYEKIERQPLFAFIHAAVTGRDSDIADGVQSLREMPLDLTYYKMENSKRKDLVLDNEQAEWNEPVQLKIPLPVDERNPIGPNSSVFRIDQNHSNHAKEPTVFLLPYWIGKYYGIIE